MTRRTGAENLFIKLGFENHSSVWSLFVTTCSLVVFALILAAAIVFPGPVYCDDAGECPDPDPLALDVFSIILGGILQGLLIFMVVIILISPASIIDAPRRDKTFALHALFLVLVSILLVVFPVVYRHPVLPARAMLPYAAAASSVSPASSGASGAVDVLLQFSSLASPFTSGRSYGMRLWDIPYMSGEIQMWNIDFDADDVVVVRFDTTPLDVSGTVSNRTYSLRDVPSGRFYLFALEPLVVDPSMGTASFDLNNPIKMFEGMRQSLATDRVYHDIYIDVRMFRTSWL